MSSSDSDDHIPLSARLAANTPGSRANNALASASSSSSDNDNVPLAMRTETSPMKRKNESDSDSESDTPLSNKVRAPKANGKKAKKEQTTKDKAKATANFPAGKEGGIKKESKAKKEPAAKKVPKAKKEPAAKKEPKAKKESGAKKNNVTAEAASVVKELVDRKPLLKSESAVSSSSQNGSDPSDDEYKWWLDHKDDGGPKWQTLEHCGVQFPPEYEPHGLPLVYKGAEVTMPPPVEEVATFFAAMLGTDHAANKVFQKNFFDDFKEVAGQHMGKHPFKDFRHCDFSRIRAHLDVQSAKRKAMPRAQKEALKKEKDAQEEKFSHCILDGRREKVGNFRIEPPGLFRGRGAHPKTGKLKNRVLPEQITINIGSGAKVPDPPAGHRWGNVTHDNTVTWLATWKENINGSIKYVFLAAGSSLKGHSDLRKFEKARSLVSCIDAIRKTYNKELKSSVMAQRQRATALYLIDRFALRAGNEKGDDEADTVGCCSLRCEHVKMEAPNIVHFDFLGKDSIRYQRTTEVDKQVWKNMRLFQRGPPKTKSDMLFDRLNTTSLNKHLQTLMPGLTAKVFRTFNASFVFQQQLASTPADGTEAEKILAYNRANREVAVLCNHQRAVAKGFQGQMSRIEDKLFGVRYDCKLLKDHLLEVAPDLKKKYPMLKEKDADLTPSAIKTYLLTVCELDREKAQKKFERDNKKLKEDGEPLIPAEKLEEQIEAIDKREKEIENGTYEPELPVAKNATTDKIVEKIQKLMQRIENIRVEMVDKDENKTTALSTSKVNYIDPRISMAWCRKYDVPMEKIFNKALREKFTWALDVDSEWKF